MNISDRLAEQRARLVQAARAVGREPSSIQLIAVSKRHGVEAIQEAYAAGQRAFGENYAQELMQKAGQLRHLTDLRWHMIGHLQSNKARQIAPFIHAVHTVSSVKLARELGMRARTRRALAPSEGGAAVGAAVARDTAPPPIRTLVEVNVSGEASKSGCAPHELPDVLAAIEGEGDIALVGLMTMPPYDPDPARARPYFERLCRLRDENGGSARLPELSMGMSHDMEVAVESGATMVRIGTAIFGERS